LWDEPAAPEKLWDRSLLIGSPGSVRDGGISNSSPGMDLFSNCRTRPPCTSIW